MLSSNGLDWFGSTRFADWFGFQNLQSVRVGLVLGLSQNQTNPVSAHPSPIHYRFSLQKLFYSFMKGTNLPSACNWCSLNRRGNNLNHKLDYLLLEYYLPDFEKCPAPCSHLNNSKLSSVFIALNFATNLAGSEYITRGSVTTDQILLEENPATENRRKCQSSNHPQCKSHRHVWIAYLKWQWKSDY